MISKIIKKLIILNICLGLTIPTNAAVSVSDGSAFVTKAEFSADLNNLSNRMAQLENSLDAKIDSLVSSYLTRNGIWNGAKQECNVCSKKDILPLTLSGTGSVDSNLFSGTYINSTNKAGMLVFSYSWRNRTGVNNNNTRWGYYGSSGNWASDNGFIVTYNFYESNVLKYSGVLLSAIGNNGVYLFASLASTWVTGNVLFFVQKESQITFDLHQYAHTSGMSSISAVTSNDAQLYFVVNQDASIY